MPIEDRLTVMLELVMVFAAALGAVDAHGSEPEGTPRADVEPGAGEVTSLPSVEPDAEGGEPGAGEATAEAADPSATADEPPVDDAAAGAEPSGDPGTEPGEPPAEAVDDVAATPEPEPEPEPDAGGAAGGGASGSAPAGAAAGAGGGASPGTSGPVASGSVRSDDDQFHGGGEFDLQEGRRRERRRRNGRKRGEEAQWQVLAPYPELGTIRYRDPEQSRVIWLGLDTSGSRLPPSLGLAETTVSVVRPAGAWAMALTPWLALGGRHSVAWFDTQTVRTRVHAHQVELSGRPLAGSRPDVALDDRLSMGMSSHAIRFSEDEDLAVEPGGLDDTIVHLGYGLDHLLGTRWRLGWQAQARYAWVSQDTQRHARVSARLAFNPRPAHRLSADAVGFYVNRDAEPRGKPLPRHSVLGQFGLGYAWVANAGVGPWLNLRYTTGFMSGEAPVYELRAETLSADYAEVLLGMMARWP